MKNQIPDKHICPACETHQPTWDASLNHCLNFKLPELDKTQDITQCVECFRLLPATWHKKRYSEFAKNKVVVCARCVSKINYVFIPLSDFELADEVEK